MQPRARALAPTHRTPTGQAATDPASGVWPGIRSGGDDYLCSGLFRVLRQVGTIPREWLVRFAAFAVDSPGAARTLSGGGHGRQCNKMGTFVASCDFESPRCATLQWTVRAIEADFAEVLCRGSDRPSVVMRRFQPFHTKHDRSLPALPGRGGLPLAATPPGSHLAPCPPIPQGGRFQRRRRHARPTRIGIYRAARLFV